VRFSEDGQGVVFAGEGVENVRVMSAPSASSRTREENGLCDAGWVRVENDEDSILVR